jgi:hypothetical protein
MKTTLDINDDLLLAAKQKALDTGKTLRHVIETALEQHLKRSAVAPVPIKTIVFGTNNSTRSIEDRKILMEANHDIDDKAYWAKRFDFLPPSLR